MKYFAIMIVVAFVLLSPTTGCRPGNQAACERYIISFNALPCVPEGVQVDLTEYCPESLDDGCDISAYYDCLIQNHTCDGDVLDTSGYADCADLATCD